MKNNKLIAELFVTSLKMFLFVNKKIDKIMSKQQEQADRLNAATEELKKSQQETKGLKDRIQVLEDASNNSDQELDPALQAAIDGVITQAKANDDEVTDVVITDPNSGNDGSNAGSNTDTTGVTIGSGTTDSNGSNPSQPVSDGSDVDATTGDDEVIPGTIQPA